VQNLGALAEFDHHCQYEMLGVPENSLADFYYLNRHPDDLSTDAMLLRPQKITVLNNDPIISRFLAICKRKRLFSCWSIGTICCLIVRTKIIHGNDR